MKFNFYKKSVPLIIISGCFLFLMLESCKSTVPTTTTPVYTDGLEDGFPSKIFSNLPKTLYYRVIEMDMPKSQREFRGVWIATVANIDWPSSSEDPYEKQKEDFIKLLDYYQSLNFNAVIVQIRTAGDAFYPSRFAPWSKYLTGKQGRRPETLEDPLSWMILESKRRGFEFHAWLNPYRATMDLDIAQLSPEHDVLNYPQWMVKYDTKYYYNPGLPEVKAHLLKIIEEVVKNYNIDAIHFDDYFYPYKVKGLEFNDEDAYRRHAKMGQSKADWRRENVNSLVYDISQLIQREKPWVQFGISPFGVWRNINIDPRGSNTRAEQTNFDDLYADVLTWMENRWLDYLIPQLYWSTDHEPASHRELLNWWSRNHYNTTIYIGNGAYKIRDNADPAWSDPMEIVNQLSLSNMTPNIQGNTFFSAKSLYQKNRDVAQLIKDYHYEFPVLSPVPHRNIINPPAIADPALILHGEGYAFQFREIVKSDYRYALIYTASTLSDLQRRSEETNFQKIYLDDNDRFVVPILSYEDKPYIALSFIDRFGVETKPLVYKIEGQLLTRTE
ncbi:family 10 glycosylhydrolase [Cecembia sp.]|uniref:glycoside hydrolase family 10 protein n=1 Tax=Cecembia sp. TaxID=1898110 RepID=UPI0025BC4233|nr:family 10 glycosylhydrolase [Cecembia sp.]